jgi:PIN domain nuclease of toxin-antitoxin system
MGSPALIVLDTHALVWAVQDDPRLGIKARQKIEREAREDAVLIPAICVWEIALLVSRKHVQLPLDPSGWMRRVLNRSGYALAPLEPDVAVTSIEMKWSNRDPADRMIVATALHWRAPLMTVDRAIKAYREESDLEVIDAAL